MRFCQSCTDQWKQLVRQYPKATRWVAFFLFMSLFFTFLGQITDPVNAPGFCRVYP
jgi:hypothetical protein